MPHHESAAGHQHGVRDRRHGGGTGIGAAPLIPQQPASRASDRRRGHQTVPLRRPPPHCYDGGRGHRRTGKYVDTLIIIPNQNLFKIANREDHLRRRLQDGQTDVLMGVRGVTDLMVMRARSIWISADIRTVMSEMGKAMMGTGEAEGGDRARPRPRRRSLSAARRRLDERVRARGVDPALPAAST